MNRRGRKYHPLRKSIWISLGIAIYLLYQPLSAHQPRLVKSGQDLIEVMNPEVSQAFYARLEGHPQIYRISTDGPFRLYVNILVPALPGIETDVVAEVFNYSPVPENRLAILGGPLVPWRRFFEPFGGDTYLQGPEYEEELPGGTYLVRVTSPDNEGKYVLAVGKKEKFPPGEILRTIIILPKLKKNFFEKSPFSAYFNLSGAFLLVVIGGVAGLTALLF